jgi:hypothetical protein
LTYDFSVIAENGARLLGLSLPVPSHHVMARGDRREEIFRDDRDRGSFLGYLSEGAERYRIKVLGLRRVGENLPQCNMRCIFNMERADFPS